MKKLFLLMLLALPAYGQIDLDPFGPTSWKQYYRFLDWDTSQTNTGYYFFASRLSRQVALVFTDTSGIPPNGTLYLNYGSLRIGSSGPTNTNGIIFEQPDGEIYLYAPDGMDGTVIQTLPRDSGRVDVHNVTLLGQDAFTGTATHDTVTIAGALPTDMYVLTPYVTELPATTNTNDILYSYADTGRLIVIRPSGGSDGLAYTWRRFRQ